MELLASTSLKLVLVTFLCVCATVIDLYLPLGFAGGIPYTFILGVAWSSRDKRLVNATAIVGQLLILIGYLFSPPPVSPDLIVLLNRFAALVVLWLLAALLLRHIRTEKERDQALRKKVDAKEALRESDGNWTNHSAGNT
jgi:hypothetical protein